MPDIQLASIVLTQKVVFWLYVLLWGPTQPNLVLASTGVPPSPVPKWAVEEEKVAWHDVGASRIC